MTATLKILAASKVGELITKVLTSAADVSADLHTCMVQCALHVREHGDTSLASRLVNEIEASNTDKSKSAAILDQQGIRFWFGMACPMVIDRATKKWKLMDKTSDTYTKYVDRMLKHTVNDAQKELLKADKNHVLDLSTSQPDETAGPGGRIFFVDYMATEPFWSNGDVQRNQQANIRVMGLDGVIGLVLGINKQVDKMIEDGRLLPDSQEAVKEFLASITKQANEFKAQHAVDIVGEGTKLKLFKGAIQTGQTLEAQAEVEESPAPTETQPEVGGDVTTGLEDTQDPPADSGSQGPSPEPTEQPTTAVA